MQRRAWTRWAGRAIVVALAWLIPLALLGRAGAGEGGVRVAGAEAFLDSVGVQTHGAFYDTAYADAARVIRAVNAIGFRHVRDGIRTGAANEANTRYLANLGRSGVRLNLHADVPLGDTGRLDEALAILRRRLLPYAASIEGANELDANAGPDWPARARAWQHELYDRAKRDPELRSLPVLSPSLAHIQDQPALGDLRGLADWNNLHAYPDGMTPSRAGLATEILAARTAVPGAPLAITETGYHNALAETGRQLPTSERAAAAYYPRLFLEHFAAGVRRTYAYELLDEKPDPTRADQEQHFGLLRNDFTPKPAAESLRRLLALARGPESGGRDDGPHGLDLGLKASGPLRRLVLRRSDGRLLVLLWQTASVWDRDARRDLARPPVSAELKLGATFGEVDLHRLGPRAVSPRTLGASRGLTVSVPADEVVGLVLGAAPGSFPLPFVPLPPRPRRPAPAPPPGEPGRREPDEDGDPDRV